MYITQESGSYDEAGGVKITPHCEASGPLTWSKAALSHEMFWQRTLKKAFQKQMWPFHPCPPSVQFSTICLAFASSAHAWMLIQDRLQTETVSGLTLEQSVGNRRGKLLVKSVKSVSEPKEQSLNLQFSWHHSSNPKEVIWCFCSDWNLSPILN